MSSASGSTASAMAANAHTTSESEAEAVIFQPQNFWVVDMSLTIGAKGFRVCAASYAEANTGWLTCVNAQSDVP